MAENSNIEWTDHTFNPWEGCQKVAPECDNCYAENRDKRFTGGKHWGPGAPRRRTSAANWRKPLAWERQAGEFFATHGRRQRVFCASLADVFDNAVDPSWRSDLFDLIRQTPSLDWLLLTKRPQNMRKMLPADWGIGWPNVWLGTSAGSQKTADTNIPHLLATPAAIRFVSAEPLLGPVDLTWIAEPDDEKDGVIDALLGCNWIDGMGRGEAYIPTRPGHEGRTMTRHVCSSSEEILANRKINWIIVGGESGPSARPMHPDWARSLRDQCAAAGVPFFFKQWGEWVPVIGALDWFEIDDDPEISRFKYREWQDAAWSGDFGMMWCDEANTDMVCRVGKARAGRRLDGREWNETPKGAHDG